MSTPAIRLVCAPSAALAYHVLAHLDLGSDAASLFDPRLPPRPWQAGLLRAYRAAPGRLRLHALPLVHPEDLEQVLRESPQTVGDGPGRTLALAFADAMQQERSAFLEQLAAEMSTQATRHRAVRDAIGEELERLRAALWEQQGESPSLHIYDCPALRAAGRGTSTPEGRAVAVSLAESIEHVLCQVLHEEIHAVTDAVVWSAMGERVRDTRVGAPGHAVHEALEHAAVEVGEALIAARAPRWSDAYHRWRRRYRV